MTLGRRIHVAQPSRIDSTATSTLTIQDLKLSVTVQLDAVILAHSASAGARIDII